MDKTIKPVKKPWQKPELVVLVRGNPEEAVLTACKVIGSLGYHNTNNSCLLGARLRQHVCSSISAS